MEVFVAGVQAAIRCALVLIVEVFVAGVKWIERERESAARFARARARVSIRGRG